MHGAPLVREEVARVPAKIELRLNDGRTSIQRERFVILFQLALAGGKTTERLSRAPCRLILT